MGKGRVSDKYGTGMGPNRTGRFGELDKNQHSGSNKIGSSMNLMEGTGRIEMTGVWLDTSGGSKSNHPPVAYSPDWIIIW